MKNKVKELRAKIDGTAQLVKELKPQSQYRLNINAVPDGMTAEEFIYNFRQHGWELYDAQKGIDPIPQQFKEIEKSYDSLILAKAWLGKVLGELGEKTPYKNDGKRKTVEDIEPASDSEYVYHGRNYKKFLEDWDAKSYIEKVDWLRERIKECYEKFNTISFSVNFKSLHKEPWLTMIPNINTYLSEARMWLGFELQRVKENE